MFFIISSHLIIFWHSQKYFHGDMQHFQIIHITFNPNLIFIRLLACIVFSWAFLLQLQIKEGPLTHVHSSFSAHAQVARFCVPRYLLTIRSGLRSLEKSTQNKLDMGTSKYFVCKRKKYS